MEYRLSRCDYQDGHGKPICSSHAFYRVTVISSEGPTCDMLLCSGHVAESWRLGIDALRARFPELKLSLGYLRLDPVPTAGFAVSGTD
jgi:hypothetical protein